MNSNEVKQLATAIHNADKPRPFQRLEKALDEMNTTYPRPTLPLLSLSPPFDVRQRTNTKKWPNAELPGVYIFLDEQQQVLYVGKESHSKLNVRLDSWFTKAGKPRLAKKAWVFGVHYVVTICVPKSNSFEAPAIEEFLIRRLCPLGNKHGRSTAFWHNFDQLSQ